MCLVCWLLTVPRGLVSLHKSHKALGELAKALGSGVGLRGQREAPVVFLMGSCHALPLLREADLDNLDRIGVRPDPKNGREGAWCALTARAALDRLR